MLWLEDAGDVLQGMILLQFRTSLGVCGMASTSSCAAIFAKFNGVRMLFLWSRRRQIKRKGTFNKKWPLSFS